MFTKAMRDALSALTYSQPNMLLQDFDHSAHHKALLDMLKELTKDDFYAVTLSQELEAAPVVGMVFDNSLPTNVTLTWSRATTGLFALTATADDPDDAEIFPQDAIYYTLSSIGGSPRLFQAIRVSGHVITLNAFNLAGVEADGFIMTFGMRIKR